MNQSKIDFWLANNQNVLFIGKHGVGKTAVVKEAFERHKLNYRYFSASTMDPWVDFIGVPKEKKSFLRSDQMMLLKDLCLVDPKIAEEWILSNWNVSKGSAESIIQNILSTKEVSYLDLIKPEAFANGEIEALFFDEFNRSPKKVRNAVMELLQFKSINGNKFPKLKVVWAAINPEDDAEYDVEKIDPAQKDRFHVFVTVPYRPNVDWFRARYGNRMADAAIQWWDDLEDKSLVSPRRLQYALDAYINKGDIRDVLPLESNVSKLSSALSNGPILEKLEELMKNNEEEQTIKFLANENNYSSSIKYIVGSSTLSNHFLPLCPKEKISALLAQNDKTSSFIISNYHKFDSFKQVIEDVMKADSNKSLIKKIRKHLTESQFVFSESKGGFVKVFYNDNSYEDFSSSLKELVALKKPWDTVVRELVFSKIKQSISKEIRNSDVELCLSLLCNIKPTTTEICEKETASIWDNFIPILNHLICEGVANRSVSLEGQLLSNPVNIKDFQTKNVSYLSSLYLNIKLAGLDSQVIRLESQLNDVKRV